jgi:hypothetical protein
MTDLLREEFEALRATIRERGTARVWIFFASLAAWGALATAIVLLGSAPVFTLIPLVVLAAGFEAIFNLHIGVERIGRYVQAFMEEPSPAAAHWETAAMAFGRGHKAVTSDPLFAAVFLIAALVNALPAVGEATSVPEIVTIAGAHAAFFARVAIARRAASSQRQRDLERFRALRHHGER